MFRKNKDNSPNLKLRHIDDLFRLFDLDGNGKIHENEVSGRWLLYGKRRMADFSRLNLGWGPIRLQTHVNEEVRKYIRSFIKFLIQPYDNNLPSTLRSGNDSKNTTTTTTGTTGPATKTIEFKSVSSSSSSSSSNSNSSSSSSLPNSVITLTIETEQKINHVFSLFDHDKDKIISVHDFSGGISPLHKRKISELFKHFDHNNDNQITIDEFKKTLVYQAHWFL